MNKLTKSAIAVAAGVLVLLGGTGTFAVWNDTKQVGTQSEITAGTLDLGSATAGTWKDQTGATITLATFRAAPGDTLTYTTTMNLTATGKNLKGTVSLGDGVIAAKSAAAPLDVSLAKLLKESAQFTINSSPASTFVVTGSQQAINISVTITWPSGTAAADNAAKLGAVSMSDFGITVTQTLS